ncbi:galactose-1-phosphate uridylyltransferase [Chloroflexota bacterium]
MSELRQDPTTKEWVIMAPERARRPQQTPKGKRAKALPDWDKSCPFCPGNEKQTPGEVFRIPASSEHSNWDVRVVPNMFAALNTEVSKPWIEEGRLTRGMNGFGVHEVIIESSSHNTTIALMTYQQVEKVLTAYQQRYNALKKNQQLKFITIFKNHGPESGTSLVHPHSQLVATPIMTPYYHRRFDVAVDYYADTGRCLYCDVLIGEIENGKRIITETEQFIVFNPYASRVSYETWIIPKGHYSSFGLFPASGLSELSIVLKDTLFCLYNELDNPAFNLMVDTTITEDEDDPYYHWHIRIVPRVSLIAGFEIGSGIYITSMLPEETAQLMRQCCIHYNEEGKVCILPPAAFSSPKTR